MTKKQMVEAILSTYDEDMMKRYGKWIARQPKATVEQVYTARIAKIERKTKMTKRFAIAFLMNQGWNKDGAEVIVNTAIEDGDFENMTIEDLKSLSNDYMDR